MKKVLLFVLLPLLGIAQIKIGADIDGEAAGDQSGVSVSLSSDGTTLAIGANRNGLNDDGSVRVYKNVSGTWIKIGADIDGEAAADNFGESVSLSSDGTIVAIGAPSNDGSANLAGSVRVYKNVSGTWTKIGADIDGEAAVDTSGRSVSISGDGTTVAIGSPLNSDSGYEAGSVRVYKNVSGIWTKIGADIDGEAAGDASGATLSISTDGTTVAIGAPRNDGNGFNAGSVRVYKNILGTWTKIGADIDAEAAADASGRGVSLSSDGTILAIGAPNNDGNGVESGSVRVYKNISGTWTKIGADIDGEAANDFSGASVSLSNNGNILAIGAYLNDGNGSNAGSVRMYQNVTGTWTKIGLDIDGEAVDDWSGYSVSLTGDGTITAIGAYLNNSNGNDAGSVRVYNLSAVLSSDSFVFENFKVFPNPTSEKVTITLQENLQLEKVNIYNKLGQLIQTENNNNINVSTLAKGSYYFEVITNKGKATKTIVIQ